MRWFALTVALLLANCFDTSVGADSPNKPKKGPKITPAAAPRKRVNVKVRAREDPEIAGGFVEHDFSVVVPSALKDLKVEFVSKHKAKYGKEYHVDCVEFEVNNKPIPENLDGVQNGDILNVPPKRGTCQVGSIEVESLGSMGSPPTPEDPPEKSWPQKLLDDLVKWFSDLRVGDATASMLQQMPNLPSLKELFSWSQEKILGIGDAAASFKHRLMHQVQDYILQIKSFKKKIQDISGDTTKLQLELQNVVQDVSLKGVLLSLLSLKVIMSLGMLACLFLCCRKKGAPQVAKPNESTSKVEKTSDDKTKNDNDRQGRSNEKTKGGSKRSATPGAPVPKSK